MQVSCSLFFLREEIFDRQIEVYSLETIFRNGFLPNENFRRGGQSFIQLQLATLSLFTCRHAWNLDSNRNLYLYVRT